MTKYHSDDYVKFLKGIRPDNVSENTKQMSRCELITNHIIVSSGYVAHGRDIVNVGEDCPVFDGVYEFCQLSAGGSIGNSRHTLPLNHLNESRCCSHLVNMMLLP